jgi:uncharacterized membrane protein
MLSGRYGNPAVRHDPLVITAGCALVAGIVVPPPRRDRRADRRILLTFLGLMLYSTWHSLRVRGVRRTALFALPAMVVPFLGEFFGANILHVVHYPLRPKFLGVPLSIIFGWYKAIHTSYTIAAMAVGASSAPQLAAGTAVAATALDLAIDPMAVDSGLWSWRTGGRYAPGVRGVNGAIGIPLSNFAAWLILCFSSVWSYLRLVYHGQPPQSISGIRRHRVAAVLAYLALYAPAVRWAIRARQWQPLLASGPLVLALLSAALVRRDQGAVR